MSVINQMLNGLEQRGVHVSSGQVRVVRREHRSMRAVLMLVLFCAVALLVWRTQVTGKGAAVTAKMSDSKPPVPPVTPPDAHSERPVRHEITARKKAESQKAPEPRSKIQRDVDIKKSVARQAITQSVPDARTAPQAKRVVQSRPLPDASNAEPVKQISQSQLADAQYRRAVVLVQQGKNIEALAGFEAALRLDAGHDAARRALVAMLLEGGRSSEAAQVLQDGLKNNPASSGFAMLLARLQVQRNDTDQAIATLENTLQHGAQQAEYQAFYAALLQRKGRHQESVDHYRLALKSSPNSGVWLMGYGISLQALSRTADAKEAYQRALDAKSLSTELQAFVQQRIKTL